MTERVKCPNPDCDRWIIKDANNFKCKCEQKGGFKMWVLGKIICYTVWVHIKPRR